MIDEIKKVRNEAMKVHGAQGFLTIGNIANIFSMYSYADEIEFIGFDVPTTNPILGRFTKWKFISPYLPETTCCKIQYANHLDEIWRFFVVCKELCHSLYTYDGSHSVSNNAVVNLVNSLSLASASGAVRPSSPFMAEQFAEFGALEILVPVSVRQHMLASGEYYQYTSGQLSKKLNCPEYYIPFIFSSSIISFSLKVL